MSGTKYQYCSYFEKRHMSENCMGKQCCFPSLTSSGFVLLAVVEVVDTPEAFSYDKQSIVVVKEEKWCSIRMLVA
ncbi:hypothetical protein PENTCL1PPCAC_2804, partial [Pristionchus entomophagus]